MTPSEPATVHAPAELDVVVEVPLPADFDSFYAGQFERAVGLAYALCGNRGAAEELAQEAFIDAYRRWDTIGAYDDPTQWIRRVVANRSVSRWRRLTREAAAFTRLAARPQPTMGELDESSEAFWALVRQLPNRQARVVALYYRDDLSVADIAEAMACTENTVKAHLFKGRQTLARTLAAESASSAS